MEVLPRFRPQKICNTENSGEHHSSNWLRWISTNAFSLALSTFGWLQHAILFKCFHPFLLPFETTSIASIGQFLNQSNPTPLVGLEEITGWHFGTSLGLDHEIRLWGTIQMAMWSRIIPVKCNGWWVWKLNLKIYVLCKFIYLMITETFFLVWWSTPFCLSGTKLRMASGGVVRTSWKQLSTLNLQVFGFHCEVLLFRISYV